MCGGGEIWGNKGDVERVVEGEVTKKEEMCVGGVGKVDELLWYVVEPGEITSPNHPHLVQYQSLVMTFGKSFFQY